VANITSVVEFCNKGLVKAYSKLRVEFVYKAWHGMFIPTNFVVLIVELKVIYQWLKKTAGFSETTEVKPHLP